MFAKWDQTLCSLVDLSIKVQNSQTLLTCKFAPVRKWSLLKWNTNFTSHEISRFEDNSHKWITDLHSITLAIISIQGMQIFKKQTHQKRQKISKTARSKLSPYWWLWAPTYTVHTSMQGRKSTCDDSIYQWNVSHISQNLSMHQCIV